MVITDETVARLHVAAESGAVDAARKLGRLLCLVPEEERSCPERWVPRWPGEHWLRAVLAAQPDDGTAAVLLAGLLTQQIDACLVMDTPTPYFEPDEPANPFSRALAVHAAVAERFDEALDLYVRVLRGDPDNPAAKAGLVGLRIVVGAYGERVFDRYSERDQRIVGQIGDVSEIRCGYSFYCLDASVYSGSAGVVARLIATDPDELRWAGNRLLGVVPWDDPGVPWDDVELTVHSHGTPANSIGLNKYFTPDAVELLDWDAIRVTPLTGELLPMGHPVQIGRGRWVSHYGMGLHHDI